MELIKYTDQYGKVRKGKEYTCQECGVNFINRVDFNSKYCSRECASSKRYKTTNRIELICNQCGNHFLKLSSKLNSSKSGFYFCSRECKDIAQRLDGIKEIHPSHYGLDLANYSSRAKLHSNCCNDCNFSFTPLLVVHHIDGDRSNNELKNLEVLCSIHHQVRHMRLQDGEWVFSTISLTPRDKIQEINSLMGTNVPRVARDLCKVSEVSSILTVSTNPQSPIP